MTVVVLGAALAGALAFVPHHRSHYVSPDERRISQSWGWPLEVHAIHTHQDLHRATRMVLSVQEETWVSCPHLFGNILLCIAALSSIAFILSRTKPKAANHAPQGPSGPARSAEPGPPQG